MTIIMFAMLFFFTVWKSVGIALAAIPGLFLLVLSIWIQQASFRVRLSITIAGMLVLIMVSGGHFDDPLFIAVLMVIFTVDLYRFMNQSSLKKADRH